MHAIISNAPTLHVGIGGLPDTIMRILKDSDFKDLGLHTEMVSEGAVELIEEGIITNACKKLDKNKSVFTFCIGTKKLYEKLDRNPSFAIEWVKVYWLSILLIMESQGWCLFFQRVQQYFRLITILPLESLKTS